MWGHPEKPPKRYFSHIKALFRGTIHQRELSWFDSANPPKKIRVRSQNTARIETFHLQTEFCTRWYKRYVCNNIDVEGWEQGSTIVCFDVTLYRDSAR